MWLAGNSIGKEFVVTSFGESHGKLVGIIIDGCPAGLPLSEIDFQMELDRRIPLQKPEIISERIEKDAAPDNRWLGSPVGADRRPDPGGSGG